MVRLDRIELSTPAWKAEVLPLNYSRELFRELLVSCKTVKPRFQSGR